MANTPAELADLHERCFTAPRPWLETEFAELLAQPSVFLAVKDAAFVLGRVVLDEAELLTLAVAPEIRRNGVGAVLLAQFEAEAFARGANQAFLEVAEDNVAALRLYQGQGWLQVGRRRGYVKRPQGGPIDALVLSKRIAADKA